MPNIVYTINKGINQPICFKGLKAQYIAYLAVGLVFLLILFAILYIIGVHTLICLVVIGVLGGYLSHVVYTWSRQYGAHGMMKKLAARRVPGVLVIRSRRMFVDLDIKAQQRRLG